MVYSLLSPGYGQCGTTTAAAMLSMSLGLNKPNDNVLLTETNMSSIALTRYFGKDEARTDYSKNLAQICATLGQKTLSRIDDIKHYMSKITDNIYLYSSGEQNRDEGEVVHLFETFVRQMPYQHIVLDINTGLNTAITKKAIELSDEVIVVINQNKYLGDKTKQLIDRFSDKSLSLLINNFDASIGRSVVTAKLGVRAGRIFTLSHSSYIIRYSNTGRLEEVFEQAKNKNGDLLDISAQMQSISRAFISSKAKSKGR